jgi:hypothetical protein
MAFVRLTDAWGYDGTAPVMVAALEDAGFHPAIDCDPRGWMHFYGWPFGAPVPMTIWIPDVELQDALGFLAAPCEPSSDSADPGDGFSALVRAYRRWIYLAWLFGVLGPVGVVIAIAALVNFGMRSRQIEGE